jgi:uncharacterized protein YndB with AHSA1/START domain
MSQRTIQPAPVRKTLVVKADIERSFTAFTSRIGSWWPRNRTLGSAPQADVIIESRIGGRWYERGADGSECEWGKVLRWEPPSRLVLAWQIDANFKYDPGCVTEVELKFTALGAEKTRVEFEHRHLERLGERSQIVRDMLDSGWVGILDLYVKAAQTTAP